MQDDNGHLQTLAKGAISGGLSRTCASPLEVVKIYQQTKTQPGLLNTAQSVYVSKGWRGFFEGNGTNMCRVLPNYALNFLAFEQLKDPMRKVIPNKDVANLIAGSVSGAGSIAAVYPLETVRTYMTLNKERYPTIASTARDIVSRGGIRALYNGLSMSMLNAGPYIGINFAVFHALEDWHPTTNPVTHFLYGSAAGTTSVLCTHPTDLVRNRLHIQRSELWKGSHYTGVRDATTDIYRREGLLGFYSGAMAASIRVSISMGVMFAINKLLGKWF